MTKSRLLIPAIIIAMIFLVSYVSAAAPPTVVRRTAETDLTNLFNNTYVRTYYSGAVNMPNASGQYHPYEDLTNLTYNGRGTDTLTLTWNNKEVVMTVYQIDGGTKEYLQDLDAPSLTSLDFNSSIKKLRGAIEYNHTMTSVLANQPDFIGYNITTENVTCSADSDNYLLVCGEQRISFKGAVQNQNLTVNITSTSVQLNGSDLSYIDPIVSYNFTNESINSALECVDDDETQPGFDGLNAIWDLSCDPAWPIDRTSDPALDADDNDRLEPTNYANSYNALYLTTLIQEEISSILEMNITVIAFNSNYLNPRNQEIRIWNYSAGNFSKVANATLEDRTEGELFWSLDSDFETYINTTNNNLSIVLLEGLDDFDTYGIDFYKVDIMFNDTIPPTYSLLSVSPENNTEFAPGKQYTFSSTWTDLDAGLDTILIEIDGTNYSAATGLNGDDNYSVEFGVVTLDAGVHNYTWWANDTRGNGNATEVMYFTVAKNSSYDLDIQTSGAVFGCGGGGTTCSGYYADNVTTTGINCPSELTCNLYLDNVSISSPSSLVHGVGVYEYVYNSSGNSNYTTDSFTMTLTIAQSPVTVTTLINNTDSNITISAGESVWLNGTVIQTSLGQGAADPEGNIKIYNNGTLINDGPSGAGNLTQFDDVGAYNITVVYEATENFSAGSDISWVFVEGGTPPYFTDIPTGYEFEYGDRLLVDFDATDDVAFDSYAVNDSRFTINSVGLLYDNQVMGVGNYVLNITINDTQNNLNSTLYYFNITQNSSYDMQLSVTAAVSYPTETTAEGTGCPSQITCNLYRDSVSVSNPETITLGVAVYNYTYNTTGNENYTSKSLSLLTTVTKGTPTGSLTNTDAWTVNDGEEVTIGLSESNTGDADLTYEVFRDGVSKGTGETITLPIGTYTYILNTTGGTNYTGIASLDTQTLTVISDDTYNLYYSPKTYSFSATTDRTEEKNVTIYMYDDSSSVVNYTISVNMTSQSFFTITKPPTIALNSSDSSTNQFSFIVQIQANSSIPNNVYTGNVTLTNQATGTNTVINLSYSINPPAGKPIINSVTGTKCTSVYGSTCSDTISIQQTNSNESIYKINNSGGATLFGCEIRLSDTLEDQNWITISPASFDIDFSEEVEVTVDYSPTSSTAANSYLGYVSVYCSNADSADSPVENDINNRPLNLITITETNDGGGSTTGGGFTPGGTFTTINETELLQGICGNNICEEGETFLTCQSDCRGDVSALTDCLRLPFGDNCIFKRSTAFLWLFIFVLLVILFSSFFERNKSKNSSTLSFLGIEQPRTRRFRKRKT